MGQMLSNSLQPTPFHLDTLVSSPSGTPSLGAMKHASGECKPCAWFWKPNGCQNGKECLHCHACPEGELKNRKTAKATMMQLGLTTPKAGRASNGKLSVTLNLANHL